MDKLSSKQSYEEYYIDFNFTKLLGVTTVSSATVVVTKTSDDSVVTSTLTDVDLQSIVSPHVYVWLKGGVSGEEYKITCKIITSNGSKYELDASIDVLDE